MCVRAQRPRDNVEVVEAAVLGCHLRRVPAFLHRARLHHVAEMAAMPSTNHLQPPRDVNKSGLTTNQPSTMAVTPTILLHTRQQNSLSLSLSPTQSVAVYTARAFPRSVRHSPAMWLQACAGVWLPTGGSFPPGACPPVNGHHKVVTTHCGPAPCTSLVQTRPMMEPHTYMRLTAGHLTTQHSPM